jgi:hypothetical protein
MRITNVVEAIAILAVLKNPCHARIFENRLVGGQRELIQLP